MLFKIPFRNIKRSMRDYTIYFFTLIIGVAIFYVFNAISGQAAMLKLVFLGDEVIDALKTVLSGVSVFVAFILAFLIVYASRLLMKRRNKEFAVYMLLGMSKRRISAILFLETIIVGIFSLAVGLVVGIGLSQLMSAVVAGLFEQDMSSYEFMVSGNAIMLTCLFFAVMYLMVLIFNGAAVTRMKLIDLIHSGSKSENIKARNPILCVVVFLISAAALGFAYYQVGWNSIVIDTNKLRVYIAIGALATFFVFWSVSGMMLRIVSLNKKSYFRGLNVFTFRQISSRINTMVFSMTAICLMLFLTICALAASFTVRNSLNEELRSRCPADASLRYYYYVDEGDEIRSRRCGSLEELYRKNGYNLRDGFSEYVDYYLYGDPSFKMSTFLGAHIDDLKKKYANYAYSNDEDIIKLSDYNELMKLYGKETYELEDGQYIMLCDVKDFNKVADVVIKENPQITVFGKTLTSKYDECLDGFIEVGGFHGNYGLLIVPDSVVPDEAEPTANNFSGNYVANDDEGLVQIEKMQQKRNSDVDTKWRKQNPDKIGNVILNTKQDLYQATIGIGATAAFIGLYLGLIFLIACGAILALKELSESIDSIPRYEILRKMGAEEKDISASLFRQTSIFFILPLILAALHSVSGIKFAIGVIDDYEIKGIAESVAITCLMLLIIYGGYFLVTYLSSKNIIKQKD